jgi:hypothetical protein
MPCYDPTQDSRSVDVIVRDNPKVAAMLCAVLSFMENDSEFVRNTYLLYALDNINWHEAGVTRKQLESWWEKHKKEDEVRRDKQAKKDAVKAKKAKALSKLTTEERRLLGL